MPPASPRRAQDHLREVDPHEVWRDGAQPRRLVVGGMSQVGVAVKKSGKYPSAPMTRREQVERLARHPRAHAPQPSPLQRMLGGTPQHPNRVTELMTG